MKIETNSKIVRNRSLDNTYDNCERFYCSESDKRGISVKCSCSYILHYLAERAGLNVNPRFISTLNFFEGITDSNYYYFYAGNSRCLSNVSLSREGAIAH